MHRNAETHRADPTPDTLKGAVKSAVDGPAGPCGGSYDSCASVQDALMAYQDRELGSGATTLVREHLRRCDRCREELAALAGVRAALQANDPSAQMPETLSQRRHRRILWAWTHPLLSWCVRHHRWVSLLAALLGLLAVAGALRGWRLFAPPPEGIDVQIGRPPPSQAPGP